MTCDIPAPMHDTTVENDVDRHKPMWLLDDGHKTIVEIHEWLATSKRPNRVTIAKTQDVEDNKWFAGQEGPFQI
ncbi:hypothetical protein ACLOJK_016471 [Asimina triloba]